MNIGIERHSSLVYEGTSNYGHPVWPSPILLQVVIASEGDSEFKAAQVGNLTGDSLLFREETYNSSSRVRRGRLYRAGNLQPASWQVYPHPVLPYEIKEAEKRNGTLSKDVYSFSSFRLKQYLHEKKLDRPIFLLGAGEGFTIWTLVNIETSATGDEVVALRARKSIGALPHLEREKILAADGKAVLEKIETLEEELFRAGPESIVDRSREAATAILSKYLQSAGKVDAGKDLGALAKAVAEEGFEIVANAARIIARLHARAKHAEQEKKPLREITEQDAEFAVQAVGTILCDIGWGRWQY